MSDPEQPEVIFTQHEKFVRTRTKIEGYEMAGGLPGSVSKASNRSQAGDAAVAFEGSCGLPDCQKEAGAQAGGAGRSRPAQSQASVELGPGPCGQPGCNDPKGASGKEVCLYRGRNASGWGRLTNPCCFLCEAWKRIQSDPFYWSLFKASVYFILGLKLFRDLAAEFSPIPKCARS